MENRVGSILDPCCGTGTIPKAAYELKIEKNVSRKSALGSVWASDKFQYPLQLCTLALTDPMVMGEIVQVFRRGVFELQIDEDLRFTDPDNGTEVTRKLEAFNTIVSNLPFVRFEDIQKAKPRHAGIFKTEYSSEIRPVRLYTHASEGLGARSR